MHWIKLTAEDTQAPVYVNLERVVRISPYKDGAYLEFEDPRVGWQIVTETPEHILRHELIDDD